MIYGELPTKPVVFAACDREYFYEHAPSLIYSLNDIGKDIHIHICDPTGRVHRLESLLRQDIDVDITFTYNEIGATPIDVRAYYSCLRFMILPEIIKSADKVLTVDTDCIFMNDFDYPDTPTGYFPRQSLQGTIGWEAKGTKVAAGCVYMDRRALPIANAVTERISEGPMRWFIDQISLAEVFERVEDKDITKFDGNFMDWEFIDNTVIWTGKGPRKYENKKYVAAKNNFNRLPGSLHRVWDK
jgi:hypothetical protein|tara:strand:+ start:1078 stop:1806 length:729 start_codon:yes stop_codon:yes gene_type:complete